MKVPEIILQEGKQVIKEAAKTVRRSKNNGTVPIVKKGADIIGDAIQIGKKAERGVAENSNLAQNLSKAVRKPYAQTVRELKMIPTYLELAVVENANRFKPEEIELITSQFARYKSDACLTDILKELLEIGATKGKAMTAKEISLYLNASTQLPKQNQENILKLVKAIKEREPIKYDAKFIDEFWTYDKYKELRHVKNDYIHETEDSIRECYKGFLEREKQSATMNEYYRNFMAGSNIDLEKDIFTPENIKYLRHFTSKVNEPEFLSKLMLLTSPQKVLCCANALERIYKLSDNNMDLACDLVEYFTGSEIFQIGVLLNESKADILKLYSANKVKGTQNMLKYLGLEGKIRMSRGEKYVDAMAHVISGNYEGGKRR